jgi:hypothetical protein
MSKQSRWDTEAQRLCCIRLRKCRAPIWGAAEIFHGRCQRYTDTNPPLLWRIRDAAGVLGGDGEVVVFRRARKLELDSLNLRRGPGLLQGSQEEP